MEKLISYVKKIVLECAHCNYKGDGWKALKPTKETMSFRAKCPKCEKIDNFMEFGFK